MRNDAPERCIEEEVKHFKTRHIIKQVRNALERNSERLKVMAIKFQDDYFESVESLLFTIEDPEGLDDGVKKGSQKPPITILYSYTFVVANPMSFRDFCNTF